MGLVEQIDKLLGTHPQEIISPGQVVKYSYPAQFLVQAVHISYWDAIVNNFRDRLLEQSNERVVQGRPCIYS
jgi:hypothetical protein